MIASKFQQLSRDICKVLSIVLQIIFRFQVCLYLNCILLLSPPEKTSCIFNKRMAKFTLRFDNFPFSIHRPQSEPTTYKQ